MHRPATKFKTSQQIRQQLTDALPIHPASIALTLLMYLKRSFKKLLR
jgi:hypothetical protein